MIDVDYYGTLCPVRAAAVDVTPHGSIVGVASCGVVYGCAAYSAAKLRCLGCSAGDATHGTVPTASTSAACYALDVDTPMLAARGLVKPAETKAIAGSIKPLSAARWPRAILPWHRQAPGRDRRRAPRQGALATPWRVPPASARSSTGSGPPGLTTADQVTSYTSTGQRTDDPITWGVRLVPLVFVVVRLVGGRVFGRPPRSCFGAACGWGVGFQSSTGSVSP